MTQTTTASKLAAQAAASFLGAEVSPRGYKPRRFNLGYQTEGLHASCNEAHRAVQWLLNDITHNQLERARWVFLGGKSGCGKTHLARAAVNALKAEGWRPYEAQFWSWRKVLALVRNRPDGMAQLQTLPFLALDDVGAGYLSSDKAQDFAASVLLELLEGRLGQWTLITSNLSRGDIAECLDSRVASRLVRGMNECVDMSQAGDFCAELLRGGMGDKRPSLRRPPNPPAVPSGEPEPPARACTSEERAALVAEIVALCAEPHFNIDNVTKGD